MKACVILTLNHRKCNKCQKLTTSLCWMASPSLVLSGSAWIRLGLALPRSGCTSRRFRSPREGGELCGGAQNVAVEQGVVFFLCQRT